MKQYGFHRMRSFSAEKKYCFIHKSFFIFIFVKNKINKNSLKFFLFYFSLFHLCLYPSIKFSSMKRHKIYIYKIITKLLLIEEELRVESKNKREEKILHMT